MREASQSDGRIRFLVQYYGAGRTGRWAGRGAQIQNYPRPTVKQIGVAIKHVKDGAGADTLSFMFGPTLEVVSTALRGCFIASPGKKLVVCDFSQIEARVVCWLAGQQDILDVFASGQDVYVFTAARIGSKDRQLGKVAVLGLGYGMGADKFVEAALVYGIVLTPYKAQEVVYAWRGANGFIVRFWHNCDRAARRVISSPGVKVNAGRVQFSMGQGDLAGCMLIRLPSGRQLVYRNARLVVHDGRESITYDGVNQYTRKWEAVRTYGGKLVENITQAVARDLMADAPSPASEKQLKELHILHDEAVGEAPEADAKAKFDAMRAIMANPPAWADGLPLGGEGFIADRYGK
jgi:DNA polymerase